MAKFKGSRKVAILFTAISIVWIGVLFTESSQPPAQIMGEIYGLDKLAHFVAFGILAFFICIVSFSLNGSASIPVMSAPFFVAALSGVIEEGYQMTVPYRAGSLQDLIADICGAMFVVYLINRTGCLKYLKRWL
jgi:VanZ family protein